MLTPVGVTGVDAKESEKKEGEKKDGEKKDGEKTENAQVICYDPITGLRMEKISLPGSLGCKLITEDGAIGVGFSDSDRDKNPRLWDIWNNKSVVIEGHQVRPSEVVISPDRKHVATYSAVKDPLRIFEYPSGKLVHVTGAKFFGATTAVLSFSPDGKTLAVQGMTRKGLLFFDVESGKTIGKDLNKLGPVISPTGSPILFLADGKHVVCSAFPADPTKAQSSQDLEIWNVKTQMKVKVLPHTVSALGQEQMILSPDGKLIARSSNRGTIHIWHVPDLVEK